MEELVAASGWSELELAAALLDDAREGQMESFRERTGWGKDSLVKAMALTPTPRKEGVTDSSSTRDCIELTSDVVPGSSSPSTSLSKTLIDLTLEDYPVEPRLAEINKEKENVHSNANKGQKNSEDRPLFELFKVYKKAEAKHISSPLQQNFKGKSFGYLGKEGYVINKSRLSPIQIQKLKSDLYMVPFVPFNTRNCNSAQKQRGYSIFRETQNEVLLPRFYGIENFGMPNYSELNRGMGLLPENATFAKPLRDYQEEIVAKYMHHVGDSGGGGILEVFCGGGKTIIALKIISLLKRKALIMVHKEFLLNQWMERIQEFLPNCRVGRIQAQKLDINDKDIVIGMVQTLYARRFSHDVYSQFGITVVDEVHRVGSEEFSKALFRSVTHYMLGISATVNRSDKLTKLLYMFIGPKIYGETRVSDEAVTVRAIEYSAPGDDEFSTLEVDYKGNTKYSTMIKKLCSYSPRSEFIVRVLKDLLIENSKGQVMVLAHNKNLLKYLHDRIVEDGEYTVGYYVGGMKEEQLKETEHKQIIIATYAMAAEALDIKTLSRLVMATPKTDITQPVGRILRTKHDDVKPIIVDIVDSHKCFQNQYQQRKRYYRKSGYVIQTVQFHRYQSMTASFATTVTNAVSEY